MHDLFIFAIGLSLGACIGLVALSLVLANGDDDGIDALP